MLKAHIYFLALFGRGPRSSDTAVAMKSSNQILISKYSLINNQGFLILELRQEQDGPGTICRAIE